MKFFKKFRKNEKGATAIEYGLIAALVSVAIIAALNLLSSSLETNFGRITSEINNAGN